MVALGISTLGALAAAWLVTCSLTAVGAHRRGQRWRFAWLTGLFFPLSWVIWYVVDERAAGGRATRQTRRELLYTGSERLPADHGQAGDQGF